jgi:hypothetical protein
MEEQMHPLPAVSKWKIQKALDDVNLAKWRECFVDVFKRRSLFFPENHFPSSVSVSGKSIFNDATGTVLCGWASDAAITLAVPGFIPRQRRGLNLNLSVLAVATHEQVHCLCADKKNSGTLKDMHLSMPYIKNVTGLQISMQVFWNEFTVVQTRTLHAFRLFSEGVTECLAREVWKEYLHRYGFRATDTEQISRFVEVMESDERLTFYYRPVRLVRALMHRMAERLKIDESELWSKLYSMYLASTDISKNSEWVELMNKANMGELLVKLENALLGEYSHLEIEYLRKTHSAQASKS